MIIRDIQKCIHIIAKYGTIEETTAADRLRCLTWNHNSSYEILDPIVDENLIKIANAIRLRVGKTEDWYMQDDPELKVYKIEDCEWWVSDLSLEETVQVYCKEYGFRFDEFDMDDGIKECDIENEGMYWSFDISEVELLIKALLQQDTKRTIFVDENKIDLAIGDGASIWIPFKRAIELDRAYKGPYCIASTEY